jgi:hypothetical protein
MRRTTASSGHSRALLPAAPLSKAAVAAGGLAGGLAIVASVVAVQGFAAGSSALSDDTAADVPPCAPADIALSLG